MRGLVEDPSGDLWIGTHGGGLNRLDRAKRHVHPLPASGSNPASLGNDYVFAVLEDRDGTLWVGTYGGGLDRFDRATGTFTRYTVEDGLASDSVYGILEDAQGRLWISTNNGLSRFDPRDGTVPQLRRPRRPAEQRVQRRLVLREPSRRDVLRRHQRLQRVLPGPDPPQPPAATGGDHRPPALQPLGAAGEAPSGRAILARPIEYTDAIELSHRDQVVTFEFAALHFTAPRKNQYAYRLEGFHEGWIPTGADRRFATFTGLAPGRYVFRVKAANSDGVWNEQGTAVTIVVTPPFWATWWFRLAILLAVAGLVLALDCGAACATSGCWRSCTPPTTPRWRSCPPATPGSRGSRSPASACRPTRWAATSSTTSWPVPRGPLCIAVGDVSGKAMKAAMMAVLSNGMLWARAGEGSTLDTIMNGVNRSLHTKIGRRMFTALCLASVTRGSRRLTFVNAGLCEPLLATGGAARYLPSTGPTVPLGVFPDTVYETTELTLQQGDVVVLFSDGLPEARNRAGEQLGYDAMLDLVRRLDTSLPAARLKEAIVREVAGFSAGSHQQDDIALVVVKVL